MMRPLLERVVGDRVARIAHTTRANGDLSTSNVAPAELHERRRQVLDLPWRVVRQVHSDRVVTVQSPNASHPDASHPDASHERPVADALVTECSSVALAVHAGDCVPVGLISDAGVIGAAHAGWKGLEAGVLEATVRAMGTGDLMAAVGPHIRKERYEFGQEDLDRLARRFGSSAASKTATGTPALDLTAAIASELERLGVNVVAWSPDCTAAQHEQYWSHRARQEAGRIALVAWFEETK